MNSSLQQRIADLDARLREAAKPINVLKYLNWPDAVEHQFLADWQAGNPRLPDVSFKVPDWSQEIEELDQLVVDCEGEHPVLRFLAQTAWSYAEAGRMLMAAGSPEFSQSSIRLYGRPDDVYQTQSFTGVDAARFLLEKTAHLLAGSYVPINEEIFAAVPFANRLRRAVQSYFADDAVEVLVDDKLSSKAIAGTSRIRVRASAMFSDLDFDQLYHHEALVHMATAINGKRQSNLQCLGLSAPRTTRTQEGLAVFAELVTHSIDIQRLRRLALRILAIKMALEGANFLEVFQFFLSEGQDPRESYKSTQRVFRGGKVEGSVAFTKDCTYLKGLMETHVFLNIAIRDNRPELISRLFAGRLTLGDVVTLGPAFDSGFLTSPRYIPVWASDTRRLAAALAYSSFMMNVDLKNITLDRFVQAENRAVVS
ncbi:tyrosine/phenylalanine carboxypeptidase domain-containing protein [Bremerella sp.]|uniref:tyrosine/phenylalanine carboxypeptidase domain-containing protein n=1 Tax=Bremerella sp. TaxID=2795602 RepID=UPI00391AEFA2